MLHAACHVARHFTGHVSRRVRFRYEALTDEEAEAEGMAYIKILDAGRKIEAFGCVLSLRQRRVPSGARLCLSCSGSNPRATCLSVLHATCHVVCRSSCSGSIPSRIFALLHNCHIGAPALNAPPPPTDRVAT